MYVVWCGVDWRQCGCWFCEVGVDFRQNVNVLVEWELLDQNGDDIWCFEEPAKT